jgi:hypothetical protein
MQGEQPYVGLFLGAYLPKAKAGTTRAADYYYATALWTFCRERKFQAMP